MDPLSFEIRHADGRHERTTAHGARIVIGSGAHCDVRLAADQAAFEHIVIEELAAGPQIRNLAPASATMLDGAPFASRALGPASLVFVCIGTTQIRIAREIRAAAPKSSAPSPAMIAKLLVVLALAGAIAKVATTGPDTPSTAAPPMPELFAKTSADCPRTDLAEARTIADDERAMADGARDRSPFDPRESRAAVKSYDIAAACYRLTLQADASESAAQSAKRMREETLLDFRARRVRLERVLLVNDYDLAAQDVAVLSALTEGQSGEYQRWLAEVAQDIKNHNAAEQGK